MKVSKTEALVAVIASACAFGAVNIVWRYGEANAITLSSLRALLGVLILAPFSINIFVSSALKDIFMDRRAWPAIIAPGVSIWAAAWLFTQAGGALAAATISLAPITALAIGAMLKTRKLTSRARLWVFLCTFFACATAFDKELTLVGILPAIIFLLVDAGGLVVQEKARASHSAKTITMAGLLIASVPAPFMLTSHITGQDWLVVLFIATVGTTARVARAHSLAILPASAVSASGQITAFIAALGGLYFFQDNTTIVQFVFLAASSIFAMLALNSSVKNKSLR